MYHNLKHVNLFHVVLYIFVFVLIVLKMIRKLKKITNKIVKKLSIDIIGCCCDRNKHLDMISGDCLALPEIKNDNTEKTAWHDKLCLNTESKSCNKERKSYNIVPFDFWYNKNLSLNNLQNIKQVNDIITNNNQNVTISRFKRFKDVEMNIIVESNNKKVTRQKYKDFKKQNEILIKKKEENKIKEFVRYYDTLTKDDEKMLMYFCRKKIERLAKSTIHNSLKKILEIKNSSYNAEIDNENEMLVLIRLQSYILKKVKHVENAFSVDISTTKILSATEEIYNNGVVDLEIYSIHELIYVYKMFVKVVMQTNEVECIMESLMRLLKGKEDIFVMKNLAKYLPGAFTAKQREVLKGLFSILDAIALNEKRTKMKLKDLMVGIAPLLINQKHIKKLKHVKTAHKIVELLYVLDYDRIDKNM